MPPHNIPIFYRVWFAWVDPLAVIPTIYAIIFKREFFLDGLVPGDIAKFNPYHAPLCYNLAALYAYLAFTQWFILRAAADIKVWRIIEAAILISLYTALGQQGRLNASAWRWQDFMSWEITSRGAVIRSLFLAGAGMKAE